MKKNKHFLNILWALPLLSTSISAASLTTTFTGVNGFTGNMFSATILKSLTVNSLAVNVSGGSQVIDVYEKSGPYLGFETNPALWTLASATTVTGLGAGIATVVNLTPFSLLAGNTYALYVTLGAASTGTMFYSDGNSTYSDSDLSLSLGEGIGGQFGSNGVFPSRTWNGTINYSLLSGVTATPEPTSLALLGVSLVGLGFLRRKASR